MQQMIGPCRRCRGLVVDEFNEVRCLICGDRPLNQSAEPGVYTRRIYGPEQCVECGEPRMKRFSRCRSCHGLTIKRGYANAMGR